MKKLDLISEDEVFYCSLAVIQHLKNVLNIYALNNPTLFWLKFKFNMERGDFFKILSPVGCDFGLVGFGPLGSREYKENWSN